MEQSAIDSIIKRDVRALQCTACTKYLQRDSRSIRNASPVVGAAKHEQLKGLPSAYEVFLFPGDRQPARRNSRPCRPQSRRLSELSVFRKRNRVVPFTLWAFRISVVVVFALLLAGDHFPDFLSRRFTISLSNFT